MIHYNDPSEQAENALLNALKTLKISQLLRKAGIRKAQGAPVSKVFNFLFLLVFRGKNLFRIIDSQQSDEAHSKNTYYRFLNKATYAWRRFLHFLSLQVVNSFRRLTDSNRVNVLILDDTVIKRNCSKHVELLARVYDHTSHSFLKGFTMLALGWSDGYSTVPVDFAMLSSNQESNRYQEISSDIDKRCHGYKRRKEAIGRKPDIAFQMVQNALEQGFNADYLLMDTWFTHEPLVKRVKDEGLDVIGMVKDLKQRYSYNGQEYTLKKLKLFLPKKGSGDILGSIIVSTKNGLPVKIVYVKNRNNKKYWLTLLCTDLTLSNEEIVRIYGNRWGIEVFFKSTKSLMKLGREFQGRSYDMMISHTTIVFTRYILLEWLRRNENDPKTLGGLFYHYSDDIQDMDLKTALQSLMNLFIKYLNNLHIDCKKTIESQLQHWIGQQASYIKALFADLAWES